MGTKALLMVDQADEADTAIDEMPAKAAPLRVLRLALFWGVYEQFQANGLFCSRE